MPLPIIQPIETINEVITVNHDSFDDEFRLLESTLTDLKEDDTNPEDRPKRNENPINASESLSLGLVDITPGESFKVLIKDDGPRSIPINCEEAVPISLKVLNNETSECTCILDLGSANLKSTRGFKTNDANLSDAHSFPLPTTQHFKPTGECKDESLTNINLVSSSENLSFKCDSLNSVSNCAASGIMQSSSNPLCSVQENINIKHSVGLLAHCNPSTVNVAPCDSSVVESQDGTIQVLTNDSLSNAVIKLDVCKRSEEVNCLELECNISNKLFEAKDEDDSFKADSHLTFYPVTSSKTATDLEVKNKSFEHNQIHNLSQPGETKIVGNNSENNSVKYMMLNDRKIITESDEVTLLNPTVKNSSEWIVTDSNKELKENSEILTLDELEDNNTSTSRIIECNSNNLSKIKDVKPDCSEDKLTLFCSTPIVNNVSNDNEEDSVGLSSEPMTPLNAIYLKSKMNLKRKNLCLERIEEVDEYTDDGSDKRLKLGSPTINFENKIVLQNNDVTNVSSSSMPCFETPAKSILKKWHPSGLSRESFFILDECGETEMEETVKPSQESVDHSSVILDDFEIACKSLAEELFMSSSKCETLEKYYSQIQLDSKMDDKKFDEVLQEFTLNYELDEKSFLPKMNLVEENKLVIGENVSKYTNVTLEESTTNTENKENPLMLIHENASSEDKTILAEVKGSSSVAVQVADNCSSIKQEENLETSSSSQHKVNCEVERLVTIKDTDEKVAMDEEDVLLDEGVKVEQKPFVYFEYVSSDPKENEDNYNPEWQKLGKLTSDEERYKAVRDRWRSLVPPDPNRDLTCRQWRKKNNKPPLNIPSFNNNQRLFDNNQKNQLCTAVFERKIANILQDLQMQRTQIAKERQMSFEDLANTQDEQQRRVILRGTSTFEIAMLQKNHIQECIRLKNQFDMRFDQLTKTTESTVMALKKACDEVMSFQKFYKGVGATDREVCMYMTDIQVEELMETEEMLERYSKYYQ